MSHTLPNPAIPSRYCVLCAHIEIWAPFFSSLHPRHYRLLHQERKTSAPKFEVVEYAYLLDFVSKATGMKMKEQTPQVAMALDKLFGVEDKKQKGSGKKKDDDDDKTPISGYVRFFPIWAH